MNKTLIGSLVGALGIFVLFGFVIPGYSSMRATMTERSDATDSLEEMQAARDNILKLSDEYDARSSEINKMDLFMPENERLDYLITSLEAATAQSGVQLITLGISDGSGKTDKDFAPVGAELSVNGSYTSFMTLLKTLEKSLRLFDVTTFSVSDSADGQIQGSLTIRAYYLGTDSK